MESTHKIQTLHKIIYFQQAFALIYLNRCQKDTQSA